MIPPEKLLDFIDNWTKKPNTPLDDLLSELPPGPSHVLSAFILDKKYKIEKAKLARKQLNLKKKELRKMCCQSLRSSLKRCKLKFRGYLKTISAKQIIVVASRTDSCPRLNRSLMITTTAWLHEIKLQLQVLQLSRKSLKPV